MRANEHIRKTMRERKVAAWQVGQILGVSEMTVFRRLRLPLPPKEEARIMAAIEAAAREV